MKHRVVLVAVAAVAPLLTAGAAAARPAASLIDVHEIRLAARPGGGTANCSNDGAHTANYVLTGWAVQGSKTALFNTTTTPSYLSTAASTSAFQASFNAWNGAPNINVTTSTSSSTKPTANRTYEVMFGKAGGTTLAVTYTWRWSDGTIESDTLFNTSVTWAHLGNEGDGCYETAGAVYDVANIATHEFGHTYGLDHPSGARYETMYAYGFSGETLKRSPTAGDLNGIQAIY